MPHLFDLPDEIISMIAYYLDGYSRIHLSKSCKRFNYFFIQNPITRRTSFPFHYSNENNSANCREIKNFIKNNHVYITHLDISYSHWKYDLILWIIKNITNLKYLNVVGADIYKCSISTLLETNMSIDSVEYSYNIGNRFPMKKLKYLHIVIDCYDDFNFKCLEDTTVDLLEITAASIQFDVILGLQSLTHINEITLRLINYKCITYSCISIFVSLYDKYYIAVETTSGIFTSPEITNEFISMNNLIICDAIENLRNENAVTVYLCSKNSVEKSKKFKNKIKDIISNRSSLNIALYGSKFSPTMHFDIVQYLALLENIERLSFHPRFLKTKAQPRDRHSEQFKPKRISRNHSHIKETSILEKITTTHKNIEMIQIIKRFDVDYESGPEWILDPRYLESITFVKKLKYLTLTNCPHLSFRSLKVIFEQCPLLEQLSITTENLGNINNIAGILNICKNIRTFHLDSRISEIHRFLNSMESSTLSSAHITYYDENYRVKENELQNSLMQIPSRCPRLRHLTVYNASNLPDSQVKHLSRIEKYVNRNNDCFIVNLKTPKNLTLNRINDIGQFI